MAYEISIAADREGEDSYQVLVFEVSFNTSSSLPETQKWGTLKEMVRYAVSLQSEEPYKKAPITLTGGGKSAILIPSQIRMYAR